MRKVNRHFAVTASPALFLGLGLAFIFLYAGVASLLDPFEWIGFLPGFLDKIVDPMLAIKVIAGYELVLGLWLLSGKWRRCAAVLAALTLLGIIVANTGQFIITFRDVGLLFAALALFFLPE